MSGSGGDIASLLSFGTDALSSAGVENSSREASSLLELAIGRDRTFIIAHPEHEPDDRTRERFLEFIRRRSHREPFHYLKGTKEFYGLDFVVSPAVLIPRPETEMLVERAIELLQNPEKPGFCEVGVGSGCISISILKNLENAEGLGLEISDAAISVARENAARHGVEGRFEVIKSDLFWGATSNRRFDLVVSNPPYVPIADLTDLQPEVKNFEPVGALTDGGDGLSVIRRLVAESPGRLRPGGTLMFEIGAGQADAVRGMFSPDIWASVLVKSDFQGIPRLFSGVLALS